MAINPNLSTFAFWQQFDTITLGLYTIPGIAEVELSNKVNYTKAKNQGTEPTLYDYKGRDPLEFDVTIKLAGMNVNGSNVSPQQVYLNWVNIANELGLYKAGKTRTPFTIVHPIPNQYGVTTVILTHIHESAPNPVKPFIIKIKLAEYAAPANANAGPPLLTTGEDLGPRGTHGIGAVQTPVIPGKI